MAKKATAATKAVSAKTAKATKKAIAPTKKAIATTKKAAAPAKKRVTFTIATDVGKDVYLAGDFNGWDPTGIKMADKKGIGVYSAVVTLAPGEYEYKFIINNEWCFDPNCKEWRQNIHGSLNSVLRV